MNEVEPKPLVIDRLVWWKLKDGFSVKYFYKRICEACDLVPLLDHLKSKAILCLLKSKVPSKILIFDWRLILNKLSTRMELAKHGIIEGLHNVVCHLCFME